MQHSAFEDLTWHYSAELDIHIGVEDNLPNNESGDVVYARLDPGATLKRHFHKRPTADGYEAFFFYRGANMRLLLEDGNERDIHRTAPFHLTFGNDEVHGITNIASEPLYFEVICAPRHVPGEEIVAD